MPAGLPQPEQTSNFIAKHAPNPKLQPFAWLIELITVELIARPPRHPRPIVVAHREENSPFRHSSKTCQNHDALQISAQSRNFISNLSETNADINASPDSSTYVGRSGSIYIGEIMKIKRKAIMAFAYFILMAASYVVTAQAKAQTAVYSTLVFTNRETSIATQNGYFTSAGIGVGVYREGYEIGRVSTGLDFRVSYSAHDRFGLGGVRAELLSDRELVRPYAEFLLGGGTTSNVQGAAVGHMFYEAVGGVDFPMDRIDYRLLEFGIGRTPLNNATGALYTGGNLWEITVSSGIVYRF